MKLDIFAISDTCDSCGGTGTISEDIGEEYVEVECGTCNGTGQA